MPDARPLWSGNLRISLVVIPVQLFSATTTEHAISFNMIHRDSGQRIRNLKAIETEQGLQEVPEEEIVRGYEYTKGQHVLLQQDEIDALKPEAKQLVDLVKFVDEAEIDERYFEKPYYLLPDGEVADEGYAIIRDALKARNKVAVGQLIMMGRSHIVAIRAFEKGLLLNTLRNAAEIRSLEGWFDGFDGVQVSDDAVSMARELIEQRAGHFEPELMTDPYKQAVRKLLEAKIKHRAPPPELAAETPEAPKVINIMDALKKSMRSKVSEGLERRRITKPSKGAARAAKGAKKPRASQASSGRSRH